MHQSPRIVFLGTPDFSVHSLKKLLESGFNIVAVVTAPDKPAGRGMQLQQSAVKKFALEKGIPVLQPTNLKSADFLMELQSYQADLQVVIAFRMLPESVWNMPPMGTINLHASLLPDYRGAAPINWAIINGEHETGVTTFKLKHEIDTGDILMQEKVNIADDMTAGQLHDNLMHVGADLIVKTVDGLIKNSITPIPQHRTSNKIAPKIFTNDCKIDWNKDVMTVYNLIRGLSPYPGAISSLKGKLLKIYDCCFSIDSPDSTVHNNVTNQPGNVLIDKTTGMKIRCLNGWIEVKALQLEGKKKMLIQDFLMGYHH